MVVLTRDLGGGVSPASELVFFDLTNIDPTNPVAFAVTKTIPLTGAPGAVFNTGGPYCFRGLTVSRTGRFVTLLDDPLDCGDGSRYPRLFQVDTTAPTPGAFDPVVPVSNVQITQATVPFDNQASTNEALFALVPGTATNAVIYSDSVPHVSSSFVSTGTTLGNSGQQELLTNGSVAVAYTNPAPYNPPATGQTSYLVSADPASGTSGDSVATVDGASAMAVDPTGSAPQVVVVGANQIAVHASPTDKSPVKTQSSYGFTGVAAAIDPATRFAYVVDFNRIIVIDLYSPATTNYSSVFGPSELGETLALPQNPSNLRYVTAFAWTRANIP